MIAMLQKFTEVWAEMKCFKTQVDLNYNVLLWRKHSWLQHLLQEKFLDFLDMTNKDLWGMISQGEKAFWQKLFFFGR